MSYTIMYGRQFIRTGRSIIPLVLCGDNNVSECINGREVRERHWTVYGGRQIEFTSEEYMKLAESFCGGADQQHFMRGGKWVDDKAWISWVKNGIKQAKTIEEICKAMPGQSVHCIVCVYDGFKHIRNECGCFCDTTPQLENWLDEAYNRLKELKTEANESFINLELMGRKPLSLTRLREPEGRVIIAQGRGKYVCEIEDHSYTYADDISRAIVFDSAADAKKQMIEHGNRINSRMRFIKAKNKFIAKDYRILVKTNSYPDGVYVLKLTGRALRFSYTPETGKGFVSESAANAYIDKLRPRFRNVSEYSVVCIKNTG